LSRKSWPHRSCRRGRIWGVVALLRGEDTSMWSGFASGNPCLGSVQTHEGLCEESPLRGGGLKRCTLNESSKKVVKQS
jgi:hypothetical protein